MEVKLDPRMKLDDDLRGEVDRIEGQIRLFNWIAVGAVGLGMILAAGAFVLLQPGGEISEAVVAAVGVASAFWALAGLFLLYVSFLGQRVDLVYNRQELRDTREQIEGQRLELARQAEQMELQGETIGRQAFEGMFFQLLRRLSDVVASLEVTAEIVGSDGETTRRRGTGVKAFRVLAEVFESCFIAPTRDGTEGAPGRSSSSDRDTVAETYAACYRQYEHFVGHYLETLKTMLELIDQQGHEVDTSRQVYADIVSAQLSVPERAMIYYHCHTGLGDETLRRLVARYSLLKPLRPEHLVDPAHYELLSGE